jgi:hypothetical protein
MPALIRPAHAGWDVVAAIRRARDHRDALADAMYIVTSVAPLRRASS